jgi:hypothetical protein
MIPYLDGVAQTTGYTVNGVGNSTGGDVTFDVAPADQVAVSLIREVPLTQQIEYEPYDLFPAQAHESGLDLAAMRDQQLREEQNRSLFIPIEETGVDTALPSPSPGDLFRWNSAGDALEGVTAAELTTEITAASWVSDTYLDGVDYTSGVTTQLTLSARPGTDVNTEVIFDGVQQFKTEYSVVDDVITFDVPIVAAKVEINQIQALQQGFNSANSISYINATSGLSADNVQDAIDEVEGRVDTLEAADTDITDEVNTWTKQQVVTPVTVAGTTIDFNVNQASEITLTADRVLTFSNELAGGVYTFYIVNQGSWNITWPTGVKWPRGTPPVITPNGTDLVTLYCNATDSYLATITQDFQ